MKNLQKVVKILSNKQIVSALIWAAAILACSYVSKNEDVVMILITLGGFHTVFMSNLSNKKPNQTSCQST